MSDTDELRKLAELKKDGVLTEEEFEARKQQILAGDTNREKKGFFKSWLVRAPLLVVGAGILISAFSGGLPACDSPAALDTLRQAFDSAQFARTYNLSAVDISDPEELIFDSKGNIRGCSATIAMNNRERVKVHYRLEGKKGGDYLLEFEVVE